jgi:hypothetical protein
VEKSEFLNTAGEMQTGADTLKRVLKPLNPAIPLLCTCTRLFTAALSRIAQGRNNLDVDMLRNG